MKATNWKSVTHQHRCPICGKDTWCGRKVDGDAVRCMRNTEAPPGWRLVKVCQDGGTVFAPENGRAPASTTSPPRQQSGKPARDWQAEAERYEQALTTEKLVELAEQLGARADALRAIDIGWRGQDSTWTSPEVNAGGQVVGINRRYGNGSQKMIHGGHRGVIVPEGFADLPDPVLIVEGASDVAAARTMGLTAIGRSSNRSSKYLAEMFASRDVIVVGENDQKPDGNWPGHEGAVVVAKSLARTWGKPVRWVLPPGEAKDIRGWLNDRGVDLNDRDALAEAGRELLAMLEANVATISIGQNDDDDLKEAPSKNQATIIIELVEASGAELFHDPDRQAWATIRVGDHRETHRVSSKGFRIWCQGLYYDARGRAAGSQGLQDALGALTAKAVFKGAEHKVYVRLAECAGRIYLDLADAQWRAVEVTPEGWRVIADPPVKFARRRGMLPLPMPISGGSIDELRPFINVPDDEAWLLLVGWVVAALRPVGPYPVLQAGGEQGCAKSTLCRMVRALVDPNSAPLRRPPKTDHDLMIAAANGWVIAMDNLSLITPALSDAICSLATGGGLATRELYSDDEEMIFDAMRPVMVNGIDDLASRPDLLDRTVSLWLPTICDVDRLEEAELWPAFERARPRILGALLDAMSAAMRNLPSVKLACRPRMADFAAWVTAAEPVLGWDSGAFLAAYMGNRENANETAIEASPVGPAIKGLMHSRDHWQGTARELLAKLEDHHADEKTRRRRDWPGNPRAMGAALRRIAPNLRNAEIGVTFYPRQGKRKRAEVRLEWVGEQSVTSAASAANPPDGPENADSRRRIADRGGASMGPPDMRSAADAPPENGDSGSESQVAAHAAHADRLPPTHSSEDPAPRPLPAEVNAPASQHRDKWGNL